MPVRRLSELSLADFIEESASPDAFWFFLHIPKTAGSSLSAEMNAMLMPYRNLHLTHEQYRATQLKGKAFWAQLDPAIDAFIAENRTTRYRSASGHMLMPQAQRIVQSIPDARIFTFLRDPVARVISDYFYQRSDNHPTSDDFSDEYKDIAAFAERNPANKMFRHLAMHPWESVSSVISRIDETFSFVGLVEMYQMSFNILSRLMGQDRWPSWRERVAGEDDERSAIAPKVHDIIAERNTMDMQIYAYFHRQLLACRNEWRDLMDRKTSETTGGRRAVAGVGLSWG